MLLEQSKELCGAPTEAALRSLGGKRDPIPTAFQYNFKANLF